jgi:hypothetical protein
MSNHLSYVNIWDQIFTRVGERSDLEQSDLFSLEIFGDRSKLKMSEIYFKIIFILE